MDEVLRAIANDLIQPCGTGAKAKPAHVYIHVCAYMGKVLIILQINEQVIIY